jgi:hypothetical protein
MTNLSEQKIIVCCERGKQNAAVLEQGIRIARIFEKELCLFAMHSGTDKQERKIIQRELTGHIERIRPVAGRLRISSLTLRGNLTENVEKLADDYDGVMLIVSSDHLPEKLTALRQSFIPFLFAGENTTSECKRVLFTCRDGGAIKSCALWASWFARFNQAYTEILTTDPQPEQNVLKAQNLRAIGELFNELNLKLCISHSAHPANMVMQAALQKGKEDNFDLLIICNQEALSVDDLFTFPEATLIEKAGAVPVLCINSNRDMYILCD